MQVQTPIRLSFSLLCVAIGGCGGNTIAASSNDAGSESSPDASAHEGGNPDANTGDKGPADASADSSSDAGTGAMVDAGSGDASLLDPTFTCQGEGSNLVTCEVDTQFCSLVGEGHSTGTVSASCSPLPAACLADRTCTCLTAAEIDAGCPSGCSNCSVEDGGGLTTAFLPP